MFAPLILPLQVTCVLVGLVSLLAAMYWHRKTKNYASTVILAILGGGILFIPSLLVISLIVDATRYGKQEFARGAQIGDRYVEVPESATNITLYKYASGHEVRMNVDEAALLDWMEGVTNERRQFARDATPFEKDESFGHEYAQYVWKSRFAQYGWDAPEDVVLYKGWRSARGGGFDVYYSPKSQTAFISAAYW